MSEQEYDNMFGRADVDEYILCAALYIKNNSEYNSQPINIHKGFVICGRRHHNCGEILKIMNISSDNDIIEGFLTSKNRFLNRKDAYKIAFIRKQISDDYTIDEGILISEDIY